MNHHHHGSHPRTWRLVLSRLHFDDDAHQLVADEVGDCADCWRDIAEQLIDYQANTLVIDHGWNHAVTYTCHAIAGGLDAAARDRGEQP